MIIVSYSFLNYKNEKKTTDKIFIDETGPEIYEDIIAWSGRNLDHGSRIYYYNISSQELNWFDDKFNNNINIKLYKNIIYWGGINNYFNFSYGLFFFDINTKIIKYLEGQSFRNICEIFKINCPEDIKKLNWTTPVFSSKYIVWWNDTTSDKYLNNISSGYIYSTDTSWYGGEYINVYSLINQTKFQIWVSQPAHNAIIKNDIPVHSLCDLNIYQSFITFNADRCERNLGEYLGNESVYFLNLDNLEENKFLDNVEFIVNWPIYKNKIIWNSGNSDEDLIQLYNIDTKEMKIIYSTRNQISHPNMFDNYIVWWEIGNKSNNRMEDEWIKFINIETGKVTVIDEG